uniref:Uncharacterized protein n=1 Tax=Magallana gigas TaxID=29159 RepID=K1PTX7_MAGGI
MPRYNRYQPAPKNSSLRQEREKHYLNYVRRSTTSERLIEPTRLVHDLAQLRDGTFHRDMFDAILDQYRLARDEYDVRLIEKIRNESRTILCTERWDETISNHFSEAPIQEEEHVLLPRLLHRLHSVCVLNLSSKQSNPGCCA